MKPAKRRVWPGHKHGMFQGNTAFYHGRGIKRRWRGFGWVNA